MDNGGDDWGTYTIPDGTSLNFNQYYIKGEYTDSHFGPGKVIAPMEENDNSKNDRFYVMALEDINPGTYYCWYAAAPGKLDKIVGPSDNDFGQGRENTEYVNGKWNDPSLPWGAHNNKNKDMWGVIQDEIAAGWFVPSKSEWAAFGAAFGITSSNYSSAFGLSDYCWSSSQHNTVGAYFAHFREGNIRYTYVDVGSNVSEDNYVRLATTF